MYMRFGLDTVESVFLQFLLVSGFFNSIYESVEKLVDVEVDRLFPAYSLCLTYGVD